MSYQSRFSFVVIAILLLPLSLAISIFSSTPLRAQEENLDLFRQENLVAWCIVPFDKNKRTPEQRAAMLKEIGIVKLAYDYRAEHIPTFEAEIRALQANGIELSAWWFPGELNDEAKLILAILEKTNQKPQLWITGGGAATKSPEEQLERVRSEAARIRPIALAAAKIGSSVGLYNHGGWFGEPENQLEIIKELNLPNVGIVYNQHHGHDHVERFREMLDKITPHLLMLNLNGMTPKGDQIGKKILPIGSGELDPQLLRIIAQSKYRGPIGILNHSDEDAKERLLDNIDGLRWTVDQLKPSPSLPAPKYRSWKPALPSVSMEGKLFDGKAAYRTPPLAIEVKATLANANSYNILVASDEKNSADHWELFTLPQSGTLSAYMPGMQPDHVHSNRAICDGKSHQIAMLYQNDRVLLLVDGDAVADQKIERVSNNSVPGNLGIGRLVEGIFQCSGAIEWVRFSSDLSDLTPIGQEPTSNDQTVALWKFPVATTIVPTTSLKPSRNPPPVDIPFSEEKVKNLVGDALKYGSSQRGIALFANEKIACLMCHRIQQTGGEVGPELTATLRTRTEEQIVESLFWPNRTIEPHYRAVQILTTEGEVVRGYVVKRNDEEITIRDPSLKSDRTISTEEIDAEKDAGSLMPEGLAASLAPHQQSDLLKFLFELRSGDTLDLPAIEKILAQAFEHQAASFSYVRDPLQPQLWPSWNAFINRDRVYDFYTKQAEYFRSLSPTPLLVNEFPGLDGGKYGHWGNQKEETWASDKWNFTQLGSVQCGVFHSPQLKRPVPRAVCLQLGEQGALSVCFNPDTLTYDALWKDGFVSFSSVRHGFMHGLIQKGEPVEFVKRDAPKEAFVYHGFYRQGDKTVFSYRIGETEFLDTPSIVDGKFVSEVIVAKDHPWLSNFPKQWPQEFETRVILGTGKDYAVDTIELPRGNPWNALLFVGDLAFLEDGSALIATMHGDVWRVSGFSKLDGRWSEKATWQRVASGLHHPLGMVVRDGQVFVQCRDCLVQLHDMNSDHEYDFYQCFSLAFETSSAGHDFICGLTVDSQGNFYTATGNQGLVQISPDGKQGRILATGFRNPDGIGIYPDGTITVPCSEGDWTPTSMICAVAPNIFQETPWQSVATKSLATPFFGHGGPRNGQAPLLPMLYLPRGLDNSSGGQIFIESDKLGPLQNQMVHFSFGTGSHFLLLRDEVAGTIQAAAVPLPGEFLSGSHRGKVNPIDGQLYVGGMAGWGNYAPDEGCFHRVRWLETPTQLPIAFHIHENGVLIKFSEPLDKNFVEQTKNHFAQSWNYRYSGAYGSPEFSASMPGVRGHDVLMIASAHLLNSGRELFLEIPELQPANQVHLRLNYDANRGQDLFLTCHALDAPFQNFPGYRASPKRILPHPIELDLALATKRIPNPWKNPLDKATPIRIEAGKNLTFVTRTLNVKPEEVVALTFGNPDVVPHNWVLLKPGSLERVGDLANKLVSDPEAVVRHYVPESEDVLLYTDIVDPKGEFTIYFKAPKEPGRYPYLCSFPGHWMVMNGEMVVTKP